MWRWKVSFPNKGASPPAVGWAAIDSLLLGSLHNYRLMLAQHGMVESLPYLNKPRLTLLGHGIAGLMAGPTRFAGFHTLLLHCAIHRLPTQHFSWNFSALVSTPIEMLKGMAIAIPTELVNCIVLTQSLARLQLQMQRSISDRQFKGPIDAAKQIIRAHGVFGLWRGFASSALFRMNFFFMFGSVEVSC